MTKSQFNLTVRLAALLVASVAVLCLYRWYYAHGDPDARNNFSESRAGRPTPSIPLKPTEEQMRKELTQTITSQLTAFRDDDYVTAYTFSAAGIKERYPLAEFERMVKSGYTAIAQFKSAEFGVVLDNGKEAVVNVAIEEVSNRVVHYQYFLRKEDAGWKISGVVEVKPKGTVA